MAGVDGEALIRTITCTNCAVPQYHPLLAQIDGLVWVCYMADWGQTCYYMETSQDVTCLYFTRCYILVFPLHCSIMMHLTFTYSKTNSCIQKCVNISPTWLCQLYCHHPPTYKPKILSNWGSKFCHTSSVLLNLQKPHAATQGHHYVEIWQEALASRSPFVHTKCEQQCHTNTAVNRIHSNVTCTLRTYTEPEPSVVICEPVDTFYFKAF